MADWEKNRTVGHIWRVTGQESPVPGTRMAERVTEGNFTVSAYSLSRDGSSVVHHRAPTPLFDDRLRSEVWAMDADGGNARRITHNEVPESGAELSPDNGRIPYACGCNAAGEFYYNAKP